MSKLKVVVIDVGWGDSILIESEESGRRLFALVDSNDTKFNRSSALFLKRYIQTLGIDIDTRKPLFEFVLVSHGHADHVQGLIAAVREFGTKQIYYSSNATPRAAVARLISYAQRHHKAPATQIFQGSAIPPLGAATFDVLWPPSCCTETEENNHSVVLVATLGKSSFVLTGDAQGDVWSGLAPALPSTTKMFKVPHHGAENGLFDGTATPWLDKLRKRTRLAMSTHVSHYKHPDASVITELDRRAAKYYRTDEEYHLEFETTGAGCSVKFSH